MLPGTSQLVKNDIQYVDPKKIFSVNNDGKLSLTLHPGQTRAWESQARFIFVIAGTQGGKTSFGPWWLWREINLRGSGDYLAVTSNYDLFKLKMLPETRYIFEDLLGIGRYWSGERIIELRDPETGDFWADRADDPMWGRIILRSAVAKGGLESSTAKGAWLDECGQPEFSLDAWQAVRRRLSLNTGRALGTTTPYDLGWLKTEIVDPWEKGDPEIDVIRFPSIINPAFLRSEFFAVRKRMPGWKFRMMYQGLFTRPAGMIYGDFIDEYKDAGGHKIAPFDIPKSWPRYVGIDPGAVHMAKIWIAYDPKHGIYYVYRESLTGNMSTKQHAADALAIAKRERIRVLKWFIGNKGEIQQRLDFQAAGIRNVFEPPIADVESGIDSVIELLKTHRIYFFDTCFGILAEIMTYSRDLDREGKVLETIKNKNTYHHLDALRYLAVGLKKRGVNFR